MEAAATPLRHPRITVLANRVLVDGLAIDDPTAVELVRARLEAGDDPARVVADAVEIGARVLAREQTGANVEFVKAELEKTAREVQGEFAERSRAVAEVFDRKFDEAFAADSGHVARVFAKHFGDESSVAVQNQMKAVLAEATVKIRDDLRKQFTADSDENPFAIFQRAWLGAMKQSSDQQHARLREMSERMQGLVVELERARAEKEKAEAVAHEAERGTAKGRSFEEAVFAALDEVAVRQGDDCDAVGDLKGGTGKTGDVVVAIDGCTGPARGRVVFEAKASRLSKPKAIEELDRARAERQADFAVLVVPDEERIPAKMHQLREYGGDKLVACFDPEEGSTLSLEVAYSLARARVLMARGEADGIDPSAIREAIERASGAMGDVLRIKQQLTGAKTSIDKGAEILDAMTAGVRAQLTQVELLLAAGEALSGAEGLPSGAASDAAPSEGRPSEAAPSEVAPPRAAALAAAPRPRVVREPDPPFPGAQRLPF
jgi:urease gamma subunit